MGLVMELIAVLTIAIVGIALVISFVLPISEDIQLSLLFAIELMNYVLLLLLIFK